MSVSAQNIYNEKPYGPRAGGVIGVRNKEERSDGSAANNDLGVVVRPLKQTYI